MATILDFPSELKDLIFSPAYAGLSTRYTLALTSKRAHVSLHVSKPYNLLNIAAMEGHLEIMRYAIATGDTLTDEILVQAASNGQLDVLIEYTTQWTSAISSAAISNGQLNVFEYVHKKGYPYVSNAFYDAVKNGHLNIVQYGHMHNINDQKNFERNYANIHTFKGSHCTGNIIRLAAEYGHVHILDWYFHTDKLVRFEYLHYTAIEGDRANVLEWLVMNGATMTRGWYAYAVGLRKRRAVEWLVAAGCPLS